MNITVNRDRLLSVLNLARTVTETRNTLPILSHIHIATDQMLKGITILATNLEIGLRQFCGVEDMNETGACTVEAKKFYEVVKELPAGDLTIQTKDDAVRVVSGKSSFRFPTFPEAEYPTSLFQWEPEKQLRRFSVEASALLHALHKVEFAIAKSPFYDSKSNLSWELKDDYGLRLEATDGARLSIFKCSNVDLENQSPSTWLIPKHGVGELRKLLEHEIKEGDATLDVKVSTALMSISTETSQLILRLADGDFPDCEVLIPKGPPTFKVEVPQDALVTSLKRILPLTQSNGRTIQCEMRPNTMIFSVSTVAFASGQEELGVVSIGEVPDDFRTGLNIVFFLEVLGTMEKTEMVTLRFTTPLEPIRIDSVEDAEWISVIAPVRIN